MSKNRSVNKNNTRATTTFKSELAAKKRIISIETRHTIQLLCWFMSLVVTALTITTTLWNKWSKLGSKDAYNQMNPFAGIWYMCDTQLSAQVIYTCYDKFSQIYTFMVMRVLMIIACVLSSICTLCSTFVMECAACMRYEYSLKSKALIVCSLFQILAGVIVAVVCTIYCSLILRQFRLVGTVFNTAEAMTGVQVRMTIGPTIWMGWCTAVASVITGLLFFFSRVTDPNEMRNHNAFFESFPYPISNSNIEAHLEKRAARDKKSGNVVRDRKTYQYNSTGSTISSRSYDSDDTYSEPTTRIKSSSKSTSRRSANRYKKSVTISPSSSFKKSIKKKYVEHQQNQSLLNQIPNQMQIPSGNLQVPSYLQYPPQIQQNIENLPMMPPIISPKPKQSQETVVSYYSQLHSPNSVQIEDNLTSVSRNKIRNSNPLKYNNKFEANNSMSEFNEKTQKYLKQYMKNYNTLGGTPSNSTEKRVVNELNYSMNDDRTRSMGFSNKQQSDESSSSISREENSSENGMYV